MTDKKSHMQMQREMQLQGKLKLSSWQEDGDWFLNLIPSGKGLIPYAFNSETFEHVIEKAYQWWQENLREGTGGN